MEPPAGQRLNGLRSPTAEERGLAGAIIKANSSGPLRGHTLVCVCLARARARVSSSPSGGERGRECVLCNKGAWPRRDRAQSLRGQGFDSRRLLAGPTRSHSERVNQRASGRNSISARWMRAGRCEPSWGERKKGKQHNDLYAGRAGQFWARTSERSRSRRRRRRRRRPAARGDKCCPFFSLLSPPQAKQKQFVLIICRFCCSARLQAETIRMGALWAIFQSARRWPSSPAPIRSRRRRRRRRRRQLAARGNKLAQLPFEAAQLLIGQLAPSTGAPARPLGRFLVARPAPLITTSWPRALPSACCAPNCGPAAAKLAERLQRREIGHLLKAQKCANRRRILAEFAVAQFNLFRSSWPLARSLARSARYPSRRL